MRRVGVMMAAALMVAGCGGDFQRTVPIEYRAPIKQAAIECPELTPRLLAGQLDQESGFNPKAVSPAGAEGIAQFVPDTWAVWGQDRDGDGVASAFNAREAIDGPPAGHRHPARTPQAVLPGFRRYG